MINDHGSSYETMHPKTSLRTTGVNKRKPSSHHIRQYAHHCGTMGISYGRLPQISDIHWRNLQIGTNVALRTATGCHLTSSAQ